MIKWFKEGVGSEGEWQHGDGKLDFLEARPVC